MRSLSSFSFTIQIVTAWLGLLQLCSAQSILPAEIGTKNFDKEKLQRIASYVEEQIEEGNIVGCSALIFKNDKIAYHNVWGQRNQNKELAVEKDTIWRIYSMSKPVTSVAIMQLVESGKIKLDEPAATYLPEFADLKVRKKGGGTEPCKRPMTVRDLLRHTSGLTYGFFGNTKVDQAYRKSGILVTDNNLEETITKLSKVPLLYQPGERWHYSVSTDVLGRVVEVASEMSFKDYLQANIFDPLEMKDTFFTVPKEKQPRFAELYKFKGKKKLVPASPLSSIRFLNENSFYSGGGGLCSTTHDYLQFATMLMNNGEHKGKQIVSAKSIQEMTSDQLPAKAASRGFKFGLGFRIDNQGHYSWGGAAGTRFWVDPKNRMITIFMIQINPYKGGHGKAFKKLAYEALVKPTPSN